MTDTDPFRIKGYTVAPTVVDIGQSMVIPNLVWELATDERDRPLICGWLYDSGYFQWVRGWGYFHARRVVKEETDD